MLYTTNLGYSPGLKVTTLFPSSVLTLEQGNKINLERKVAINIMLDIYLHTHFPVLFTNDDFYLAYKNLTHKNAFLFTSL